MLEHATFPEKRSSTIIFWVIYLVFAARTVLWPWVDYDTVTSILLLPEKYLRINLFSSLLPLIFLHIPAGIRAQALGIMWLTSLYIIVRSLSRLLTTLTGDTRMGSIAICLLLASSVGLIGWRCDDNFIQLAVLIPTLSLAIVNTNRALLLLGTLSAVGVLIHGQSAWLLILYPAHILVSSPRRRVIRSLSLFFIGVAIGLTAFIVLLALAKAHGAHFATGISDSKYAGRASLFLPTAIKNGSWHPASWIANWGQHFVAAHTIYPDRLSVPGKIIAVLWVVIAIWSMKRAFYKLPPGSNRYLVCQICLSACISSAAFAFIYEPQSYERWLPAVSFSIPLIVLGFDQIFTSSRMRTIAQVLFTAAAILSITLGPLFHSRSTSIPTWHHLVRLRKTDSGALIVLGSVYDWGIVSVFRQSPALYVTTWLDGTFEATLLSQNGIQHVFHRRSEMLKFLKSQPRTVVAVPF